MMRRKILVVDDNTHFCNVTKLALETMGRYQVITANTGTQGITLAKTHKPDAILLDIKMPRMDGGEVAARLMEDHATNRIPVIFLTGLVSSDEVEQGGGYLSGHPFIAKPFKTVELLKKIETVLFPEQRA
ncbi:MAG TPA: response regulator [Syntrophorhabdaceae bacterium]|nr:response regulator [Syntrophorhabdaceae bacterium]